MRCPDMMTALSLWLTFAEGLFSELITKYVWLILHMILEYHAFARVLYIYFYLLPQGKPVRQSVSWGNQLTLLSPESVVLGKQWQHRKPVALKKKKFLVYLSILFTIHHVQSNAPRTKREWDLSRFEFSRVNARPHQTLFLFWFLRTQGSKVKGTRYRANVTPEKLFSTAVQKIYYARRVLPNFLFLPLYVLT